MRTLQTIAETGAIADPDQLEEAIVELAYIHARLPKGYSVTTLASNPPQHQAWFRKGEEWTELGTHGNLPDAKRTCFKHWRGF